MAASQFVSRVVTKAVPAIETSEGVGARVRRSIGTPGLRNLSPFLMLDHFRIPLNAGFADHPHRGMTTVTLMLDGFVQHEDSKGHAGTIGPGSLQWMKAGKGIVHAEMPKHYDDSGKRLPDPIGLQLWIDLPREEKAAPPDYQEMLGTSLPTVTPRDGEPEDTEGKGWKIKIIAGESHGVTSPVRSPKNGGCSYYDITLQPGGRVWQPLPKGWNAFIYTTDGALKVGGKDQVYERFNTLVLSNAGEDSTEDGVWLEHAAPSGSDANGETRCFLIAGQPLQQESFQYGPFAMCERAEVMQAMRDYQTGTNGFEGAPTWQSKIASGFGH
ncbi:RNA pol II transcription cofactor [Tilletia horrida]|uniref:RNA pol II transcription cofactor n=1 Tax=Tilletia horrida TaxID=155126 RepID=A0AAN6G6W0_9BASI|nr:RNA pol II transcription cofactor [Tilletia horrida]KAK0527952.1 RNA pol II transcription cofactor [Tilletia horrida]KAK0529433.1 RNA pol II transcription cofactor [Tilletia horrida]KAK0557387.1 RNA pol II transcription cofactor [Tilletia horrida]